MSLGSKIKRLRVQHKMSQEELAYKLNVAQTSVSNFEADKFVPDFLIMQKISEVFDVGFEYFLEEKSDNFNFEKIEKIKGGNIGCKIETINNNFPEGILENMLKRIELLENKIILKK